MGLPSQPASNSYSTAIGITQPVDYTALGSNVIPPVFKLDLARDGFHYGVKTNQQLAHDITNLLARE